MADSSTGGYLPPASSPAPLEDDALIDFIQAWVVGVSGMAGATVLPRWQSEPPNIPPFGTNWASLGLVGRRADTFAAEKHIQKSPSGESEIQRHEELDFLISFYGPAAGSNCHKFREGMQVAQNREPLLAQSMGLVGSGDALVVPEMFKNRWVNRIDLPFTLRRQVVRKFAILDVVGAGATINNEEYTETISV